MIPNVYFQEQIAAESVWAGFYGSLWDVILTFSKANGLMACEGHWSKMGMQESVKPAGQRIHQKP